MVYVYSLTMCVPSVKVDVYVAKKSDRYENLLYTDLEAKLGHSFVNYVTI